MTDFNDPHIPEKIKNAAADWLARIQNDTGSATKMQFETWLQQDPLHRKAYGDALLNWQHSRLLEQREVGRSRKLERAPFYMRHKTHVALATLGATASVCIALIALPVYFPGVSPVSVAQAEAFKTATGEIRKVHLSDTVDATLDTASELRDASSSGARKLQLVKGRSRIYVRNNARVQVQVPEGEISADNAVFDVSLLGDNPSLSVLQGSAEWRRGDETQGIRLSAGEMITLTRQEIVKPVSAEDREWVSGMLAFRNTPLQQAISAINRYNEMQIDTLSPSLSQLRITGAFKVKEPEKFVQAASRAFNLDYRRKGHQLILMDKAGDKN